MVKNNLEKQGIHSLSLHHWMHEASESKYGALLLNLILLNLCSSVVVVMADIIMRTFVMWRAWEHGVSL